MVIKYNIQRAFEYICRFSVCEMKETQEGLSQTWLIVFSFRDREQMVGDPSISTGISWFGNVSHAQTWHANTLPRVGFEKERKGRLHPQQI